MYNAERYVSDLLKCFDLYDDFNYEIIIIDDGSSDNSYNEVKKFNSSKIKLFQQENCGVSSTRNSIIEKASGEWITFIDSDDLIDFHIYKKLFLNKIKNSKCEYFIVSNQKFKDNSINYLIEHEIINAPWSKFYKVNILKEYKINFNIEAFLGEDLLFNLQYYSVCKNFEIITENLYIVRNVNSQSLTRKYTQNKIDMLLNINNLCISLNIPSKAKRMLNFIKVKNFYSSIIDLLKYNILEKDKIIKKIKYYKDLSDFKFIKFTSFRNFMFYYLWYILPSILIYHALKLKVEKNVNQFILTK